MKLLAIDTSTEKASVALLHNGAYWQKEQGSQRTHAQFLLPMVDELLLEADLSLSQLNAIVFGCGPGSFTGLRIACSVAKGLAFAHDLQLIPVSSLAAIAWVARQQAPSMPVLSVLDARMHEMYWAYYAENEWSTSEQVTAVKEIKLPSQEPVLLAGVGIEEYWPDFPSEIKEKVARQLFVYPSAKAMIELAVATAIPAISVAEAQPVYVRNQVTYEKKN